MATYYHSNGGGGRRNDSGDWWGWLPVAILFCIPTPVTWVIAFFMLVNKLKSTPKSGGRKSSSFEAQKDIWDWGVEGEQTKTSTEHKPSGSSARSSGQRVYDSGKKSAAGATKTSGGKKPDSGLGLIIGGAITAGVFALGFITTFAEALIYGTLASDFSGLVALLVFLAGGLGVLGAGLGKKRRAERYMNYLAYIGSNREVPLAHMSATFGVSVQRLCRDLREMLAKGVLPTGYLDLAEGKLYLTEYGYRAPRPKAEPAPEKTEKQAEEKEDAILREIRQVNDDIPDEEMSAKIDRIEEITRKILAYQKQHPDREKQLRSFLNYYLPTTLKILRAYAQLDAQGIEGENISAAKARIEGMMDQVVAGFEKQLDKLFQDDAMDIATDVEVLESMLRKDGLSGGEGMTMNM